MRFIQIPSQNFKDPWFNHAFIERIKHDPFQSLTSKYVKFITVNHMYCIIFGDVLNWDIHLYFGQDYYIIQSDLSQIFIFAIMKIIKETLCMTFLCINRISICLFSSMLLNSRLFLNNYNITVSILRNGFKIVNI